MGTFATMAPSAVKVTSTGSLEGFDGTFLPDPSAVLETDCDVLVPAALERQIMTELLDRDRRYQDNSEAWAVLAMTLKELAVDGANPDSIIDELSGAMERLAGNEPVEETLVDDSRSEGPSDADTVTQA